MTHDEILKAASPRPWDRVALGIWGAENKRISCAEWDHGDGPYKVAEKDTAFCNAALIVRAVNNFESLIAAGEAMIEDLEYHAGDMIPAEYVETGSRVIALRAALKLARGE